MLVKSKEFSDAEALLSAARSLSILGDETQAGKQKLSDGLAVAGQRFHQKEILAGIATDDLQFTTDMAVQVARLSDIRPIADFFDHLDPSWRAHLAKPEESIRAKVSPAANKLIQETTSENANHVQDVYLAGMKLLKDGVDPAALKAYVEKDCSKDIDVLEKAAVGNVLQARVQFLKRSIQLMQTACEARQSIDVSQEAADKLLSLSALQQAAETFDTANRQGTPSMYASMDGGDWFAATKDMQEVLIFSQASQKTILDSWAQVLTEQAAAVEGCCPPTALLEDPKLLTTVSMQKAFFENPKRPQLTGKFGILCQSLNLIKETHRSGYALPAELKAVHRHCLEVKRWGRTVIGTDFALDQILHHAPEAPEKLKAHAQMIIEKTSDKGVELLPHVVTLLESMRASTDETVTT